MHATLKRTDSMIRSGGTGALSKRTDASGVASACRSEQAVTSGRYSHVARAVRGPAQWLSDPRSNVSEQA